MRVSVVDENRRRTSVFQASFGDQKVSWQTTLFDTREAFTVELGRRAMEARKARIHRQIRLLIDYRSISE